jgi:hypothetical protein
MPAKEVYKRKVYTFIGEESQKFYESLGSEDRSQAGRDLGTS